MAAQARARAGSAGNSSSSAAGPVGLRMQAPERAGLFSQVVEGQPATLDDEEEMVKAAIDLSLKQADGSGVPGGSRGYSQSQQQPAPTQTPLNPPHYHGQL